MLAKRLGFSFLAILALVWVNGCGGKSKPISVSVSASATTVDSTDTISLTATVTNDKNSDGVSWSLSGPGALSGQSTTTVTYTAPAATSSSQSATITAASVADSSETATATITVPAKPTVTTTDTDLAAAVGASYNVQLAGSGGISPYTWAVTSGSLPPCLTMGNSGLITGTVTTACTGTFDVTFTMTDSGSPNKLTASASATIAITAAPAITFTGSMPATATFGAAYTGSAAATGGAGTLTYSLASGALPNGLNLTTTSGAVTGTPTAGGTFNFTIKAADAFGDSATKTYQIVVGYPALSITSPTTLPTGYAGTAYTQTLTATGGSGTGYTWAVTSGAGQLTAAALTLSSGGVLSGTTPVAGSASFGVQVKDSAGNTATGTLSVTIDAGVAITTASPLPAGYAGTAYSQTFAATGGSGTGYTWTVTSGASQLTAVGLSLSSAGVLSGSTPVAGSATFTVKVTDSVGNSATGNFAVTIKTGLSITTVSPLPVGYAGVAYSQTFAAAGGTGAGDTWSVTSGASSLTAVGLSLSSGGVLSGATPIAGTASFTVQVKDSAGNIATGNYSVTINAGLTITSPATLPAGYVGAAYAQTLTASGGSGTGYSWTVTSNAGELTAVALALSSGGVLSGATPVAGTASFGVQVKDSAGNTATATLSVTIDVGITITTATTLPSGYSGTAYSASLAASGGSGHGYTWTVTSGASQLTAVGLSLSAAGALTGATPVAGTASFGVQVKDSAGNTATATFSVTVKAGVSITTTSPLPVGFAGVAYSQSFAATGGSGTGYTWSVTSGASSLTAVGLSLSGAGMLSGTTPVAGTATFGIQVKDSVGNIATGTFSVTINAALAVTSTSPLANGFAGTAYSDTLAASGGSGTGYTWSVTSGASQLTAVALTLSSGGVLSGTTPVAGSATFGVQVKDSVGNTATASLTVTIGTGLTITSANPLPAGYVGTAYSDTLTAAGGSGSGRTWSVTSGASSLTAVGLSLSSGGVLSGATPIAGTATFTAKVVDSASNSATATFSVTVNAGVSIMTTSPLPVGFAGVAYSQSFAATGGSGTGYTWSVTSGASSLTAVGLSLSSGGVVSGTTPIAGTASFTVQVKDSANNIAIGTFSVTINAALTVTSTSPLPAGYVGAAYSHTLTASGGSGVGYAWTVTAGGSSLTIVGLSLSGSGVLSGATPAAGTASFTVKVTDSASNTATATLSVTIGTQLTVTTTSLPATNVAVAYSQTLTAAGGSGTGYSWTATSSNLATYGLSLSAAGVVSGTPTTSGTASFTANVKDSASNTALAPLTITIYSGLSLPAPDPGSLPGTATTGVAYSGSISGSGGSGNYCYTVTGLPADSLSSPAPNSPCGYAAGSVPIFGTPGTAETVTFGVKLTDTTTNASITQTGYNIVVSNPQPLTLPAPNPASLPSATVSQSYSGQINAAGGVGPTYTWTVNSGVIPTDGTAVSESDGLSVSSNGGPTLFVTGTPTTTGSVPLTASVTDSASHTAGPDAYSVTVNTPSQISGQISMVNNCGIPPALPTFTVSINTSPVQTTQTDSNGNYSFSNVPNGTYTITPSITGASSVFFPSTITGVTVNGGSVGSENFQAEVGYTVTGTIQYTGAATGEIYVNLVNSGCGSSYGTTLSTAGNFTIRGVGAGTYTLSAWMDTIGQGLQNANNPSGTGGTNVVVTNASSSSNFDTLVDPTVPNLSTVAGPSLGSLSPVNNGVVVSFNDVQNNNGVEEVTSYTLEWSTNSTFPNGSTSSSNFTAAGSHSNVWFLTNTTTGSSTSFVNGTSYYFRARGNIGGSNSTEWAVFGSPTSVKIGAATSGSTITGTVTIPAGVTIKAGAPLYVGLYSGNGANVYADEIASPVVGANNFSVIAPNGTYQLFAILDQNNDGAIDVGDVTNTNGNNGPGAITVTGSMSGQDFTLPATDSTATVQTAYTGYSYYLNFNVKEGNKLPVAAELTGGPNVVSPVNIGNYCQNCGNVDFNSFVPLPPGLTPTTAQSYTLNLTYSDGTSNTVTVPITGVLGAAQLATLISPLTSSSTNTPSFNWTYPANATNYLYQFSVCCGTNNSVWQIPGNNSQANGFTSSQVAPPLAWGVDPTDSTNLPSPATLTDGNGYSWQIQTMDSNGNSATASDYFIAVPGPLSLPAPNPSSLPSATVNVNYEGSITVSGGVPPYQWTVSGLPSGLGWSSGGNNNNTVFIGGTPNTVTTISFQVTVTDSTSASAGPVTYTITVNNQAAVSLPGAGTNPLGPGVTSYVYGSELQASGGSGNYTFVVNGTTIPSSGTFTAATNSDGLTFSNNNGGNTLMVAGTPISAETVSLQVEAIDSNNNSDNATVTYSVPVTTGPNGANNARIKGTYTCLIHGYLDADGSKFGIISSVVADGNGNLTGGVFDANAVDQAAESQGTFTGTYSLGSDNNGLATVNGTNTVGATGTFTNIWALAATSSISPASEFRMVLVNDTGTSPSGQHGQADCMLDTTSAFTSSTINGKNFIFDLTGADSGGRPHVTAGRYDASSSAVTTGYVDTAKGGNTTLNSTSLTGGSYTAPSATTGRYTLTVTTSSGSLTFAVYIVNAGEAFLISTEAGDGIEEGHVFTQALSSFSNANLSGNGALYIQGYEFTNSDSPDSVTGTYSEVFETTANGSGGLTINQSYMDDTGSYSAGNANGSTTGTFDSSNPGRVVINTGPGSTTILYLANTNSGIEIGAGGGANSLESGFFENQTQTTFTDAALAGNYMLGTLPLESATDADSVAEFAVTSSGTATAGSSLGGQGVFNYDQAQSYDYAFDSTAPGTGTFLITGSSGNASCATITSTRSVCTLQSDPVGGILVLQK